MFADKILVLNNWPKLDEARISVVTDGMSSLQDSYFPLISA